MSAQWDTCLVCGAHGNHKCPGVAAVIASAQPAPSAEDELVGYSTESEWPEDWRWYRNAAHDGEPYLAHMSADLELTLTNLRAMLRFHGLAIIPAADVPTPEERKVLETMAGIKQRWLEDMVRTCAGPAEWVETCVRLFTAELARRAAKEKADG